MQVGLVTLTSVSQPPITSSPLVLYNTYGVNRAITGKLRAKWPDKAIFYSEFGIKQFGADLTNQIAGIETMHRLLNEGHTFVIGTSLWTFNDYRSSYKDTPASGNREWGIVDVQRRPKAAVGLVPHDVRARPSRCFPCSVA